MAEPSGNMGSATSKVKEKPASITGVAGSYLFVYLDYFRTPSFKAASKAEDGVPPCWI